MAVKTFLNTGFFNNVEDKTIKTVLERVGKNMVKDIKNNFNEEKTPEGKKWKPLAASTIAKKARRGRSGKILVDTGKLKKSLRKFKITKKTVTVESNVPYGIFHQKGYGVPKREFIGISKKRRKYFANYINKKINDDKRSK